MCQSEFIEEIENEQNQAAATTQPKEHREPDLDSQGNQFHSCESNNEDEIGASLNDHPAKGGRGSKEAAQQVDDDDDWEDESGGEEVVEQIQPRVPAQA